MLTAEKKEYVSPELEVVEFASEDVITTSNPDTSGHYTTPRIPFTGSSLY